MSIPGGQTLQVLLFNYVHRETGEVEGQRFFTREQTEWPGYVEEAERAYDDTPWRVQRVVLVPVDPEEPS